MSVSPVEMLVREEVVVLDLVTFSVSDKTYYRVISQSLEGARSGVKCSYNFEIRQAPRQDCHRGACKIAKQSNSSEYKSRGFEALQDLTIGRVTWYWNGPRKHE